MSEHTPGPWNVNPQLIDYVYCKYKYNVEPNITSVNGKNAEHNAKLIAAAPDLLRVCQEILKRLSDNENPNSQQWICSDALHPENDDKSIVDYVAEAIKKATE